MNSSHVLIISSPIDLHARAVAWAIERYGYAVDLYDTSAFSVQGDSHYFLSNARRSEYSWFRGEPSHMSVWDRRRPRKEVNPSIHRADQEFVARESALFERNMLGMLERRGVKRWIDPTSSIAHGENKIEQIIVARECSLLVPDTLVSSDFSAVTRFLGEHGQVVVKPFVGHWWLRDGVPRYEAVATKLSADAPLDRGSVEACPVIYQQLIDKVADIRAVVVGRRIFATRYSSKEGAECNLDYRVNLRKIETQVCEAIELGERMEAYILSLLDRFGLTYASIDLAETSSGEMYFLDLNPQGQFLFNEIFVPDHHILDAMARHVIGLDQEGKHLDLRFSDYEKTQDYRDVDALFRSSVGEVVRPRHRFSEEGCFAES